MNEPHKRRWFQFSLRTLLVGVTLLAALTAAVVWVVRDRERLIRERDEAVNYLDIGPIFDVHKDASGFVINIDAATPPEMIAKLRRFYPNARLQFFTVGTIAGRNGKHWQIVSQPTSQAGSSP